jgi:diguanylate cyclase (GGDEF)-like protein
MGAGAGVGEKDGSVGDRPLRLLLVEPDDASATAVAESLPAAGLDRVRSFAEARRRCVAESFDGILLGSRPADLEALRALASGSPRTPLLLLADPADQESAHQAVQRGAAQDYLVKGHLHGGLLEQAVRYAVSRRRMLGDLKERRRRDPGLDRQTDLPDRAAFFDRLGDALQLARHHARMGALLLVGLDGFRHVRSALGPDVADPILREASARIRAALGPRLRDSDFLSRISGDEFAAVVGNLDSVADAGRAAEAVLGAFAPPFVEQGLECFVSAAVGVALFPFDGADASGMLHAADLALGRARESGAGFQFHLPAVDERFLTRLELQSGLRLALARDEFAVHYMPQLDLRDGRILSVEALLRWRHPALGLVSPADFIPLAEESGLILPIGERVLRSACAQSRSWRAAGLPPVRVSVNFSARQFQHPGPVALVARALQASGLEPGGLELEITESALMKDPASALATLRGLKELGVRLSIDDFGTGYSSLSYLRSFPIDALKVDRSFVTDALVRPEDRAIVAAVLALGRSLNLRVIAEGVESAAALEWLRHQGCDEAQGYFVGKPMPPEQAAALLGRAAQAGRRD